jgi:transcriptional regulator with XRE-family HTH domain
MQRNFLEIFQIKLKSHRIQTKLLALEAGRSASYLSEIFTGKKSPTLQTFTCLLEAADRISPGFADEYYSSLAGNLDLGSFVRSLGNSELSTLLILTGQRLGEVLPSRQKIAA